MCSCSTGISAAAYGWFGMPIPAAARPADAEGRREAKMASSGGAAASLLNVIEDLAIYEG